MKLEDYVMSKEVPKELQEFLNDIRRVINNGGYVPQTVSGIPGWNGYDGEFLFYVNGKDIRQYSYNATNSAWNYGLPISTKYGWDYITANNVASATKALSFGYTFQAAPIVLVSFLGYTTNTPTTAGSFDTGLTKVVVSAYAATTTGCTLAVYSGDGSNLPAANNNFGIGWCAIG